MRVARFGALLLAGAFALGTAVPAQAATTTISIVSRTVGFDPQVVSKPQGTTFAWKNNDPSFTHTSTQDSPLALWTTGNIAPTGTKSVTVASAGVYPYHCAIHTFMTGTVRVPIKVSATSGTISDTFTITVATTNAAAPFVYDVQRRIGSGAWTAFATGVTSKSVTFHPSGTGMFSFRSRLRDTSEANAFSGYSPKKTITVS
ncbi:MAG: cupredoxin domain-containing protein [Actinomycetota bacterium]|nr:cupredoxin domain-containing protein [Actinomycetota bacterium]